MSHRSTRLEDATYPERLRALPSPPPLITIEGDSPSAAVGLAAVAVIGTRAPSAPAERFAFELATSLARGGAVVVSGGALGIDAAAHRGALSAGGRTWAIAASGRDHCFPKEHAPLYRQIALGPGAVVWPFADDVHALPGNFLRRNGVLVALADAVVVVQAGAPSGTLNAASWAQKLGRSLWAVPGPPWDPQFTGCRALIDAGARVLTSIDGLLRTLGLPGDQLPLALGPLSPTPTLDSARSSPPGRAGSLDPLRPSASVRAAAVRAVAPSAARPVVIADEAGRALFAACTAQPQHTDKIAENAGVCVAIALTRLLTLALENVLVEGPDGFYRRQE